MVSFRFHINCLIIEKEQRVVQKWIGFLLLILVLPNSGTYNLQKRSFPSGFSVMQIGSAFMLSTFLSKSSSSGMVGCTIFIDGFLQEHLLMKFGFPYSTSYSYTNRIIWSLFPSNLLAEAVKLLANATSTPNDPEISWKGRMERAPNDTECVITINEIYLWLLATFFVRFFLAIYFDNILPNAFTPCYWTEKRPN
ncbi:ABC transporter A family member 2-like [Punica granatum]|uniref:ABC transporter A family member 2-like n=1 Tax=Punica granatum TaxID=22663 RepID=A0A6P8CV48_PUNGR|nr:ABC transporter A family member 2-like [Punica granatum]